jgi:hypothetical protein
LFKERFTPIHSQTPNPGVEFLNGSGNRKNMPILFSSKFNAWISNKQRNTNWISNTCTSNFHHDVYSMLASALPKSD